MRRKTLAFVSIMAMAIGVCLFAAPSISHADPFTITSIDVIVGGAEYCSDNLTCGNKVWSLGATGVTLNTGQSLVLTQTNGFNFDSSDPSANGGTIAFCDSASAGTTCTTTLKINNTAVNISGSAGENNLADNNKDKGGQTNEATNYGLVAKNVLGFAGDVYFGYADNVHANACQDSDSNCLPTSGSTPPLNIFANATVFKGAGATFTPQAGAVCTGKGDCFDAGAILIYNTQAVPEPVTMFLGGTGLILLGYAARRRLFGR